VDLAQRDRFLWGNLTWEELKDVAGRGRVAIVPIGAMEQHGRHLPLNTDNYIVSHLCYEVGRRIPDEVVVLPVVPFAFDAHHMHFPGAITIQWDHVIRYLLDVLLSITRHGFTRIVVVSGHGVNPPYMAVAANEVHYRTGAMCASLFWGALIGAMDDLRESPTPGGMAHACELETSVVMFLDEARVRRDRVDREMGFEQTQRIWMDIGVPGSGVHLGEIWWSGFSKTGVAGDATVASAEKGRQIFERAARNFVEFVREFRARRDVVPEDMH
jgi:creatinine amidohydrolase